MSKRFAAPWLVLSLALGIAGCRQNAVPVGITEDPDLKLPPPLEIAVADWLNLPRADLDQRFEDWKSDATKLLDVARGDRNTLALLPKLRPVLTLPVFREARFMPSAGLTLPLYAEDYRKDPALALHLARFGDTDGALLISDPTDVKLRKEIESLRGSRNYPVEWARLVTLVEFVAELRLARDEPQGAATLINLHQQLRILLDQKASAGPLGAALLSSGRRALQAASTVWDERRKGGYVNEIQAALAAWGDVPAPTPLIVPGASRAEVERLFPPVGSAHSVTALGNAAGRVFDFLALPLPGDDMEGITAFLDGQEKLAQITVLYRPRAGQTYPDASYLAQRLAEFGATGKEAPVAKGTSHEIFTAGPLQYDITLVPRGSTIGAFVRIGNGEGPPASAFLPPDPRDFGAVHFDRTFDQNRLAIAPEQRSAEVVTITKAAEVCRVAPPAVERGRVLTLPVEFSVQLQRLENFDLLAGLTLNWDRGHNLTALARIAVPLWTAYGAPKIESGFDSIGGHLALVWENETMRYTLRLPHDDDQPPTFTAEDRRGSTGAAEREKLARTFDRDQRAARLAAGKALQRLPRAFDEASAVKLGMPRSEVEAALPASQSLRKTEIAGGWNVFLLKPPAGDSAAVPQQMFVRIGPGDKVAELRLRYLERFVPKGDRTPTLLAHLSAAGGAPETLPTTRVALWNDLPQLKPAPILYRWKDDTTQMILERDAGGAEVILSDLPKDQTTPAALPPLQFVSRGVEGCNLGDAQSGVLERWKITEPTKTVDGGVVLSMPKSSPYENLVVYFTNDRVARILAYHKVKQNFQIAEVPAALQESWGRDLDHLGSVRRQDAPVGKLLGGLGWHDDVTRVRTFSLDSDQGPQIYTEWREWAPALPEKGVAIAR